MSAETNENYPQADTVKRVEGNITEATKGEPRELRRRRRPIHALQSYDANWGEPTVSAETCKLRYA